MPTWTADEVRAVHRPLSAKHSEESAQPHWAVWGAVDWVHQEAVADRQSLSWSSMAHSPALPPGAVLYTASIPLYLPILCAAGVINPCFPSVCTSGFKVADLPFPRLPIAFPSIRRLCFGVY